MLETQNETAECPMCGSHAVRTNMATEAFPYGEGATEVQLFATVPRNVCDSCDFEFTDGRAERLRHEAVCRHLGLMLPEDVEALRKRAGYSRADFSKLTKIGEASLSRWERGAGLQNGALDQLLYLLTYRDNIARLLARPARATHEILPGDPPGKLYKFPHLPNKEEKEREAAAFQLRRTGT